MDSAPKIPIAAVLALIFAVGVMVESAEGNRVTGGIREDSTFGGQFDTGGGALYGEMPFQKPSRKALIFWRRTPCSDCDENCKKCRCTSCYSCSCLECGHGHIPSGGKCLQVVSVLPNEPLDTQPLVVVRSGDSGVAGRSAVRRTFGSWVLPNNGFNQRVFGEG